MSKPIISRTHRESFITGKQFNLDKQSLEQFAIYAPVAIDTVEKAERYIRKNPSFISGKLVMVESVSTEEKLIGMELDTFIEHATKADERSAATRGMVSKTVTTLIGNALYMTAEQTIASVQVTFPVGTKDADTYVRKNYGFPGYFITVKDIREESALYCMNDTTFLKLARPMKNKFTLA